MASPAAPAEPPSVKSAPLSTAEKLLLGVQWRDTPKLVPGVVLAASVMVLANVLADLLGGWVLRAQGLDPTARPSPISAITIAIVAGLLVANTLGVNRVFALGLEFSVKKALRLGIVLVGLKLSLFDVVKLGAWGVPVVVALIAGALLLTSWFARRLGVSERLGTLAAASTAICGVTAALAVAPTIDADDREVAFTIANVTLFGLVAMFVYPYVAHALFAEVSGSAGLFLGTAIHDTSQVMGAALSYREVFHDELAMKVATVAKLTRNVFIAAVVPLLAFVYARRHATSGRKVNVAKLFPLFVLGFVAMAVLRSVGDAGIAGETSRAFGLWGPAEWSALTRLFSEKLAYAALGIAMAAVGLTTSFGAFKGLGPKPLYVGAISATLVGVLSVILAALVGPFIQR